MTAPNAPEQHEAQRQRLLLAAFKAPTEFKAPGLSIREPEARALRGLEAYRANAEALAERALCAVFATVQAMVGEDNFSHLAREFWLAHPPERGDMGEWGAEFPAWLGQHAAMAPWPYLGDCARLDLALHQNERAADAAFDAASLSLLESTDPAQLFLQLMPGTVLLRSAWPIATIHAAHQAEAAQSDAAFAAVRAAVDAQRGEPVLVVRKGWRAFAHVLGSADALWSESLLAGATLSAALECAGEAFDFGAWLVTALREQWVKGVVVSSD
jgi:Putative DNA-binding domain